MLTMVVLDRLSYFCDEGLQQHAVPSHDPKDAEYDGEREGWRGPYGCFNYMIANGLARAGQSNVANIIEQDSLTLIGGRICRIL